MFLSVRLILLVTALRIYGHPNVTVTLNPSSSFRPGTLGVPKSGHQRTSVGASTTPSTEQPYRGPRREAWSRVDGRPRHTRRVGPSVSFLSQEQDRTETYGPRRRTYEVTGRNK